MKIHPNRKYHNIVIKPLLRDNLYLIIHVKDKMYKLISKTKGEYYDREYHGYGEAYIEETVNDGSWIIQ